MWICSRKYTCTKHNLVKGQWVHRSIRNVQIGRPVSSSPSALLYSPCPSPTTPTLFSEDPSCRSPPEWPLQQSRHWSGESCKSTRKKSHSHATADTFWKYLMLNSNYFNGDWFHCGFLAVEDCFEVVDGSLAVLDDVGAHTGSLATNDHVRVHSCVYKTK